MHLDASMAPRMDYDKVAVFEGGKVVEFDSPQDRLWTKTVTDNGWFQLWKYDMRNSAVCQ
jgi:hypothetical protein